MLLTAETVVDNNEEFPITNTTHVLPGNTSKISQDMFPNTLYTAAITVMSCAGNSTQVAAEGNCSRPIDAPDHVQHPSWPTTINKVINIPPASNRAGPVR